jgi:hypothetical protein
MSEFQEWFSKEYVGIEHNIKDDDCKTWKDFSHVAWNHQQKRIDELEAQLAIAVQALERLVNPTQPLHNKIATEALNKIRMQESDGE